MSKIIRLEDRKPSNYAESFLFEQEKKGVTKATLDSHKRALKKMFGRTLTITGNEDMKKLLDINLPNNMSDAYYNKSLNTYRQFFDMLVRENVINNNPALTWKYRRHSLQIVEHTEEEVQRFLKAFKKDTFSSYRNYVFAVLILDTGMRPTEALALTTQDINFETCEANLRAETTKTRTSRKVPVSKETIHMLKNLISYHAPEWDTKLIFCTSEGTPLRSVAMQHHFRQVAMRSGVEITPYQLRHIFATTFIRNGGDSLVLKRILGHTSMVMTSIYVNLVIDDLHDAHERNSPIVNFIGKKNRRVNKLKYLK